jgi:hypothetical protein
LQLLMMKWKIFFRDNHLEMKMKMIFKTLNSLRVIKCQPELETK